jgi:hypothetical protein|uniref:Uncharacterized protein n=1 Tax=Tenebrio molitor TaxID=7067 RepID=A0A8J6H4D2_TENMO|nr:hypothetical protein GEV33_015045 [Tenebrio molitor]
MLTRMDIFLRLEIITDSVVSARSRSSPRAAARGWKQQIFVDPLQYFCALMTTVLYVNRGRCQIRKFRSGHYADVYLDCVRPGFVPVAYLKTIATPMSGRRKSRIE